MSVKTKKGRFDFRVTPSNGTIKNQGWDVKLWTFFFCRPPPENETEPFFIRFVLMHFFKSTEFSLSFGKERKTSHSELIGCFAGISRESSWNGPNAFFFATIIFFTWISILAIKRGNQLMWQLNARQSRSLVPTLGRRVQIVLQAPVWFSQWKRVINL